MMLYEWPGNVRELENAIERAVVVGKTRKIMPQDLPIFRPEYLDTPTDNSLREIEKAHISRILADNQWNISKTSQILGIDRSTLYSKIKRYQHPEALRALRGLGSQMPRGGGRIDLTHNLKRSLFLP